MKKSGGKNSRASMSKPFNDGQWTEARMRSFIMSALRRAQWPPKYAAISKAYVEDGANPKTGRKCKLHRCEECGKLFAKGDMHADHIDPVIPLEGFDGNWFLGYDWNQVVQRLYTEADKFQIICKQCHKDKSKEENAERRLLKKKLESKNKLNKMKEKDNYE